MYRLSILLLFLIFGITLPAQSSLFDSLAAIGDTVVFQLDTDHRKLQYNRKKKRYQPVNVTLQVNGLNVNLPGKIRSRGNVRLSVCDNPSLKIKLDKGALLRAGFAELNDLKIVQQCKKSATGLSYLRRERLAYELHAVYSQHHHRTVPIVLRFPGQDDTQAFLIEDEEQFEARYGMVLEPEIASTRSLHRPTYVNLCLFNYLILNTDWQVFNLHNVELIADTTAGVLIPIPYDFDYSGFVATNYSVPREGLNLSSVQIPYWLGRNVSEEEMRAGAAHFIGKRAEAEALIRSYPDLLKRDRQRILKRLADFYKVIGDETKLLKLLR